jgi:DNA-binding transcriptional regulator YbjK
MAEMVTPKSDGRLERGRARRELLLDAAVAVIASQGASQLTHRAAAIEAGVSLASVTYHFPGIDDLRRAAFAHAGSRIGLAFRALIQARGNRPDRIPELAADYVATLVEDRRQDTVAVFEMILAASHNKQLRPVIRELEGHLADLLTPYVGDQKTGITVGASIQGLVLSHLAQPRATGAGSLRDAVADLVRRFKESDI